MRNTKRTTFRSTKPEHILRRVESAAAKKNLNVDEFNAKRLREKYKSCSI